MEVKEHVVGVHEQVCTWEPSLGVRHRGLRGTVGAHEAGDGRSAAMSQMAVDSWSPRQLMFRST